MSYTDSLNRISAAKIVYWGPARCGKSENLRSILQSSPESVRPLSLPAPENPPVEMLHLDLGGLQGFDVSVHLCALHGTFNLTLGEPLLHGADGVVFIVDSEPGREEDNQRAFERLRQGLASAGASIESVPLVLQYNKRDLPAAHSMDTLRSLIPVPPQEEIEAVALRDEGTLDTLKTILRPVLQAIKTGQERG
ncbi:MAG: hypothetical protein HYT87_19185 [Nitrospirae bacterium]|nr:hypothetical protein [Nitrospirota bacterium]